MSPLARPFLAITITIPGLILDSLGRMGIGLVVTFVLLLTVAPAFETYRYCRLRQQTQKP